MKAKKQSSQGIFHQLCVQTQVSKSFLYPHKMMDTVQRKNIHLHVILCILLPYNLKFTLFFLFDYK